MTHVGNEDVCVIRPIYHLVVKEVSWSCVELRNQLLHIRMVSLNILPRPSDAGQGEGRDKRARGRFIRYLHHDHITFVLYLWKSLLGLSKFPFCRQSRYSGAVVVADMYIVHKTIYIPSLYYMYTG